MAITRLHGRSPELRQLETWCTDGLAGIPRLVVLYGRRRVGKTFLLQHLAARLRHDGAAVVYAAATREATVLQLQRFSDQIAQHGPAPSTSSWFAFWTDVVTLARAQPLVVLLDEVPYLIESDPSWATTLQAVWDSVRHGSESASLTVILTGSAVSTMTNLVSSRGALFERPDALMRLDPFDLPTASSFLKAPTAVAAIEAYAACDGYPLLLSRWDTTASASSNLERLAGDPVGALASNASTLLLDLDDFHANQRVLGAIGRGAHRLSEINSRAGQRTERPLAVLQRAGFVQRRQPIGDRSKNSLQLELADNYLRFWFALVEPNLQLIDGGQGQAVIRGSMTTWDHLVAACFEREARRHASEIGHSDGVVGEWWTDRPTQAQIDVVETRNNRWVLVGEAKWKDRFSMADLRQFERHISVAGDRAHDAQLATWSRFGSSDEMATIRPDVLSYTAEHIVNR